NTPFLAGRKKQKLAKERAGLCKLPDLKDAEAVQKFFLEEIQLGEELLAQGKSLKDEEIRILHSKYKFMVIRGFFLV
uniref:Uncharacterized protein n=1 Tax=Ursus maritimus TaxID=29073 RepID=A0A452TLE2_URSMA